MQAIPRPAPRVAPATTATLPSKLFISRLLVEVFTRLPGWVTVYDTLCHIWRGAEKFCRGGGDWDACRQIAFHHAAPANLPKADGGRACAPSRSLGADDSA